MPGGMPRPLPEDQRWQGRCGATLRDDVAAGEGGLVLEGGVPKRTSGISRRATALAHAASAGIAADGCWCSASARCHASRSKCWLRWRSGRRC